MIDSRGDPGAEDRREIGVSECFEPECLGLGKCLRQEHVDRRKRLSFDADEIRRWLTIQRNASDFGGVCEHDHDDRYELIEALLAEIERLRYALSLVIPDPVYRYYLFKSKDAVEKYLDMKAKES